MSVKKLLSLFLGLTVLSGALLRIDASANGFSPFFKTGVVAARGLVRGPNGQPIFAEFDKDGNATVIGEAVGDLFGAYVMPGDTYRAYVKAYRDFIEANKNGSAKGAYVLTRDEYLRTDFGTVDIPDPNDPNSKITAKIDKPDLKDDDATKSILVRQRNTILFPQDGPILLKSPIDLRNITDLGPISTENPPPDSYIRAVLLNRDGRVIYQAKVNIGFRSAYFSPANGDVVNDTSSDSAIFRHAGDNLLSPVPNIKIYSSLAENRPTFSDANGKYTLQYYLPPCPGFTFDYSHDLIAEIPYRNFNPKAARPMAVYYTNTPVYDFCNGLGDTPLGASLGALMAQLDAQATVATQSVPSYNTDLKVDTIMLTGQGLVSNSAADTDAVAFNAAATEYGYTRPAFDPMQPQQLDLDGDRKLDTIIDLDATTVGVFFGDHTPQYDAGGNLLNQPDVIRLKDTLPDIASQGLLKSIDGEDLKNTDLYVYRVSNDQLITEREGLKQEEYVPFNSVGVTDNQNSFYYRMLIRGTREFDYVAGRLTQYQQKTKINPDLQGRNVDFLRVGEKVRIIAINRVTGYLGSVITTVTSGQGGLLSFDIKKIILRPPNLRLRAERTYKIEAGLTKDEERDYLIGFEGGGLTSDTVVKLTTEWTDPEGLPLPADLPGYTGRLAKVVAPNALQGVPVTLSGGDQVALFSIRPGIHTVMIRLPEGDALGAEHFYVHVCGAPKERDDSNACFADTGAGSGPLAYRPQHYVPVQVPILDEAETRRRRNLANYTRKDQLTTIDNVDAIYAWPYRPEMQFSVFDLTVSKITSTATDDQGAPIERTIYNSDTGTGACDTAGSQLLQCLLDGATSVNLLYGLLQSDQDPLDLLGPSRQLIWSLGGDEVPVTYGPDGLIHFTHLDQLSHLDASDGIALRLYLNNDPENILWQFDLVRATLVADTNRDGVIESGGPNSTPYETAPPPPAPGLPVPTASTGRDFTSASEPFVFWVNDNDDVFVNQEEQDLNNFRPEEPEYVSFVNGHRVSNSDPEHISTIENKRDLEDFATLELSVKPYSKENGDVIEISAHGIDVNLFEGLWQQHGRRGGNSRAHVEDNDIAGRQINTGPTSELTPMVAGSQTRNLYLSRDNATPVVLNPDLFTHVEGEADDSYIAHLIFEGVDQCFNDPEYCYLEVTVKQRILGELKIVGRSKFYVQLRPIEELYEHYTAGDNAQGNLLAGYQQIGPTDQAKGIPKGFYADPDQYILFVHGWRMNPWERRRFAETALKRLYWQGYKGRFGLFSWPTLWFANDPLEPDWIQGLRIISRFDKLENYDRSETIARQAGLHLYSLMRDLRSRYTDFNVFAHSMGNVVTGEALRLGAADKMNGLVDHYSATQAAEVASAYNAMVARNGDNAESFLARNRIYNDPDLGIIIPEPDKFTYATGDSHDPDPATVALFDAYFAPNVDPNKTAPLAYYSDIGLTIRAATITSIYNSQDPALRAYDKNELFKPDLGWHYESTPSGTPVYDAANATFVKFMIADRFCDGELSCTQLSYVEANRLQHAQVLARIVRARARALGTSSLSGGVIGEGGIDLGSANYGYGNGPYDHSKEFVSNNANPFIRNYWEDLLGSFDLVVK